MELPKILPFHGREIFCITYDSILLGHFLNINNCIVAVVVVVGTKN
jgi:hypothetical protein